MVTRQGICSQPYKESLRTKERKKYLLSDKQSIWISHILRATSHTRLWDSEPMTITLQALSLVEKADLVQVRSTLCLRDQRSVWMQDGCKSLHGFLHGIEWIMFYGHLDYFQKPPLGGEPNTKRLGDHGTLNAHNRWFILFYHVCF